MRNKVLLKRIVIAFGALSLATILLAVFFVCTVIADIRREVVPAVLAGIADSLSDEQTLRDSLYRQMFTDAEVEAILKDHREELNAALISDDDDARIASLILLGEAGADAAPFLPDLTNALADRNPEVRRQAVFALGELGPDATSVIELIRKMSEHEHERVQPEATKAVEKIMHSTETP